MPHQINDYHLRLQVQNPAYCLPFLFLQNMNIRRSFPSFLWLLPFAAFICGYLLVRSLCSTKNVAVPSLVGLNIQTGIKRASEQQLGIQIIAEKYDPDLQPGTIINQKPHANQTARQHQLIYVVVARGADPKIMPDVRGKPIEEATRELQKTGATVKNISLPIGASSQLIVAQTPEARQLLNDSATVYQADKKQSFVLPDFRGKSVEQVQDFLERHQLPATLTYDRPRAPAYIIAQQRPLPGTIFLESQPPTIQLLAQAL
jgi:beta-lactam-binding protein with PASTA domain